MKRFLFCSLLFPLLLSSCSNTLQLKEWVQTTPENCWSIHSGYDKINVDSVDINIDVNSFKKEQTMEGFGACFNELGWTSLSLLSDKDRNDIFKELFEPNYGANFTVCRTPVGANDFARKWYSYNETPGDFEMSNFDISNDYETLIPFIKCALSYNNDIKLWASPWGPPSWMKMNNHYACRASKQWNDLKGNEEYCSEGTDLFKTDEKYFKAYAKYFYKYVEAYKNEGINIFAVAPQNEFNSCTIYPGCTWTSRNLNEFLKYLGKEMEKLDVDVILGTVERPNTLLVDTIMNDPETSKYIKYIGFQWAGRDAITGINNKYEGVKMMQTESECGDGKNDWKHSQHTWNLINHYISNGACIYEYWNISLLDNAVSTWGWTQNSLISVDPETKKYKYNYEYYVMKHLSHYVKPGAIKLGLNVSYKDILAFENPNGECVLILNNPYDVPKSIKISKDNKSIIVRVEKQSLNTIVII